MTCSRRCAAHGGRCPCAPTVRSGGRCWSWSGLAITVASGLTLGALNAADPVDYDSPLRSVAVVCIIAGPILFQIGVVLAGHWILSLLARAGARLGIAPRIATRDAAANPSRIVPAFGAIAACVFIASFALTAVSVWNADAATRWYYGSPLGTVHVDVFTTYAAADAMETAGLAALDSHRARPHRDRARTGEDVSTPTSRVSPSGRKPRHCSLRSCMHFVVCGDVPSGPCIMPRPQCCLRGTSTSSTTPTSTRHSA